MISTFTFGTKSTTYAEPRYTSFLPPVRPKPFTSVTVMPCTPISARRSFTSSSLNGLMIASTFFIPGSLAHVLFRVGFRPGKSSSLPKSLAKSVDALGQVLELAWVELAELQQVVPLCVVARSVLGLERVVLGLRLRELVADDRGRQLGLLVDDRRRRRVFLPVDVLLDRDDVLDGRLRRIRN